MPKHKPVKQTPDQIEAMSKELYQLSIDLKAAADFVRHSQFDSLQVTGYGQMSQAVKFVNAYFSAVKNAIYQARMDRGDFDSGEPKAK
jgi:hypothetical protein